MLLEVLQGIRRPAKSVSHDGSGNFDQVEPVVGGPKRWESGGKQREDQESIDGGDIPSYPMLDFTEQQESKR
jgi:hypothetical protein